MVRIVDQEAMLTLEIVSLMLEETLVTIMPTTLQVRNPFLRLY